MQLTHLIALVPVLQAVSAFPYVYDTYDLYARDLDALLYPGSQQLYARAALFPRGESDTPTVPLTSKKHPQTIKNKIAGGLPSETQMLPPGEKPYRGDQGNLHGTKGETVVDHAIEASSVEGKKASKEGKNSLMEVPKAEQDSEGGLTAAAHREANKQGTDIIRHTIDGKPAGEVTGGGTQLGSGSSSIGGPAAAAKDRHRNTKRHIFARNAAADAYAEALAVFDNAFDVEMQKRDAFAFAEPKAFSFEEEYGYYY